MEKLWKYLGCIFALIGFAYVVKQIMHYCKERCYLCVGKTKEEEKKKTTGTTASYKIKVERKNDRFKVWF